MKNFTIDEVLIYNPTLKSQKKKPIQSDIQQAKIMACYPNNSPIQQKCNTVGMAQGVYAFCDSLLPQQMRSKTIQTIFMNNCCLVQKQMQQNIWVFVKLNFEADPKYKQNKQDNDSQSETGYYNSSFTQQILNQFINHFYLSFTVFYGKISGYLFLGKLLELQKTIDYFIPKYQQINSYSNNKSVLDITFYLTPSIRSIPIDVNMNLKFSYFKNVIQSYQPALMQLMIFTNGFLTYSTLQKNWTQFFARYLFGCIQPFKFQSDKIQKRFKILKQLPVFNSIQKYGTIFNSINFGISEQQLNKNTNSKGSRATLSSTFSKFQQSQDLLGMDEQSQIQLPDVYLAKNGQQVKWKINYFIQKNMFYITFYKQISSVNQLVFSNRFFHDNNHKFYTKISQTMNNFLNQSDPYRFLFINTSTNIGKCTFKDWAVVGNQVKYTLSKIKNSSQGQISTTFQNHWVYGIKRMNRVLILLIPNQVPLHKLQDYSSKMTKQYFYKCFM